LNASFVDRAMHSRPTSAQLERRASCRRVTLFRRLNADQVDERRCLVRRHTRQQNCKLIAAQPRDKAAAAHGPHQAIRNPLEARVARQMSLPVVDLAKMIDVEQGQTPLAPLPCPAQTFRDLLLPRATIRQTSQRIGKRQMRKHLLLPAADLALPSQSHYLSQQQTRQTQFARRMVRRQRNIGRQTNSHRDHAHLPPRQTVLIERQIGLG
jgi:hypothetical protein